MKAPPSKLHQSVSLDERDFDEILRLDSPLQETSRFLPTSPDPLRRGKQPIPANRIALIRRIEEERAELWRRARLRNLGKAAMLALAVVVNLAALVVLFWLLYEATINGPTRRNMFRSQTVVLDHPHNLGFKDRIKIVNLPKAFRDHEQHITVMPKKLAHMRILEKQRPVDAIISSKAQAQVKAQVRAQEQTKLLPRTTRAA